MEYVVENGVLEKCVGDEQDVCIPEGVEQLGFFCFDTPNMQRITIPGSLKQLDHFDPGRYSDLEEINVDSENPNFSSVDGVLYNKDETELLVYPVGAKRTDFTVPNTVLTISERAFSDHKHLKCIDLRHTKVIGSNAFYCCSVEKVIMNDVETIESGAFRWSRLKHLDIPPTLKSIGNDAFDCGIQKSITVPKSVEFVSVDCFANAREISIFDNLRVDGFADYRWKWIERIGKQYRLFVYSADDDSLKFVVPVFPDGTWKMSEALREAWNQEGFFDFQTLDSYFTNVKDFECKIQIALTRIKWPVDLEEQYRDVYMKYLSRNAKKLLLQCIDNANIADFMFLRELGLIKKNVISELIEYATGKDATEFTSVLLNDSNGSNVQPAGKKVLDSLDFDREMKRKEPKKKLSEKAKTFLLEKTVLIGGIEDIQNCFNEIGMIEMPARSLGMACRFRGLEYVKALVEMGFSFGYNDTPSFAGKYDCACTTAGNYRVLADYMLLLLDDCDCQRAYGIHRGYLDYNGQFLEDEYKNLSILSETERSDIIEFLYQNKKTAGFDAGKMLYYSILSQSDFAVRKLKSLGVTIPRQEKKYLTEGGKGLDYQDFQNSLYKDNPEELKRQFEYWLAELEDDEKILIYNTYAEQYADSLFCPEVYLLIKGHADLSKVNKKKILQKLVENNNAEAVSVLRDDGWIEKKSLRDSLIGLASEKEAIETLAALNDYKNKTSDVVEKSDNVQPESCSINQDETIELQPVFEGKKFVTTGLAAADERWVQQQVEARGGEFKPKFVVSLNYLIYNPDYDHETVKLTRAKEQMDKGKDVIIITFDEFKKMI